MNSPKQAIVITGATGSGKSKIAIQLARQYNGVIINADSRQIYKQTPILSAQPCIKDVHDVKHFLYGFTDIFNHQEYSVGQYLYDLQQTIIELQNNTPEKLPIIVGGSMLYIDAIINGINEIPQIPEMVKNNIRNKYRDYNVNDLFEELKKIDLSYANIVDKTNPHRILRGLEVKIATNKSIIDYWNNDKKSILNEYKIKKILIELPRDKLYENINQRFDEMISCGAIEEAENILDYCKNNNLDICDIPKIIGLQEIINYLSKKISFKSAIEQSKQATRNYAKRQLTWFRNKLHEFEKLDPQNF